MKDQLTYRIKIGDKEAFELLFRRYYIRLCRFANKFLNDPEEAFEVVQDVFTELWEGRENIDPCDSLISYIFKITQNKCINRLRRKQVESKYIEIYKVVYVDHSEISPYDSLLANELNERINAASEKLPPKCRKIFKLSREEGLKYKEIALFLRISVKTVEAQMTKAMQILRLELIDYLDLIFLLLLFKTIC